MLNNIDQILDSTGAKTAALGVKAAVCEGKYAYFHIPEKELGTYFDKMFPVFAENKLADTLRGRMHRWKAGHDLFVDIPKTFVSHGPADAIKQTGHILLTDLGTKDGLPIPGLSYNGLGKFLNETCHIPKARLCFRVTEVMDIADKGIGIFACSEGFLDLVNAFSHDLRMTPALFFDTFIEGAAEIAAGAAAGGNPLLYVAGGAQIVAGLKISLYTISHPLWFVNPLDFFGGVLTGGIISFFISKIILKKDTKHVLLDVARSCAVGGAYAVSTCFGIAVLVGLTASGIGKLMAERTNAKLISCFKISEEELDLLRQNALYIFPPPNEIIFDKLPSNESIFAKVHNLCEFQFEPSPSIFFQELPKTLLDTDKNEKSLSF